jgi:uncharacterized membrane protein YphA (DoxX/SURF4 family)
MSPLPQPTARSVTLVALRVAIAAVFLYASADKIVHPDRFAEVVSDYQLLPEGLVNAFAAMLPWVELGAGLVLLIGRWLPGAALLTTGLTAMFMVAVALAMRHGGEAFHCGCFTTTQEGGPSATEVLARDALLLAACGALMALTFGSERRGGDGDGEA